MNHLAMSQDTVSQSPKHVHLLNEVPKYSSSDHAGKEWKACGRAKGATFVVSPTGERHSRTEIDALRVAWFDRAPTYCEFATPKETLRWLELDLHTVSPRTPLRLLPVLFLFLLVSSEQPVHQIRTRLIPFLFSSMANVDSVR